MLESICISAVTLGLGGLMTYAIIKKTMNTDHILDITDELLNEITQNTEMQKKVYIVGAILGNGIKSGIGIGKTSGKFKMEDLIGIVVSRFLGGQQTQPATSQLENLT